jgi:leucyl aminopeptidase
MFGFDSDNDRCFELHVGTLEESDVIGQCVVDSIDSYRLDLPRYDYLTFEAIDASDHGSFWEEGIGAVEFLEDMDEQDKPGGCPANDPNPAYHTPNDTADRLNPESGIQIVRAALASIAGMANIIE